MRENLIMSLSWKQAVQVCEKAYLGNVKLINQLTKKVIIDDYIRPSKLSYKELVKLIK